MPDYNEVNTLHNETLRLKIMSYNIRHGRGMDDRVDLQRIAEVIRQTNADIVGLQEVDEHWGPRSGYENQTMRLAERLGMEYVFGGSIHLDPIPESGGKRRKHGVAVLSKYPILSSRQRLFSTYVGNHRELLETEIDISGYRLHFYSTHWGLDADERRIQSNETIRWVKDDGPAVVVGDFNSTLDSPEMELLIRHFHDAFNGDETKGTFPANDPAKRIDFIVGNGGVRFDQAEVIPSAASDHLPIVCVLEIQRQDDKGKEWI
ncbi:hypothetical protein PAESOLCIP111_02344 [Paenibacillus solanacearum]|uniref:Endonuclease/exonuclease/phosphatase domain-containing protein n=1 Tax=Paenibacillus solanacearum TaxID=2048548 RepID=A0A916K0B8_9BACL|nr:endonuclease/exonuclease/phosphatase family protein [Paenibacillus solanacearum]CAG7621488.1 hypothetical protein PAESOLCIP111_02344 [Paenibacillus solanacearum]